MQDLCHKSRNHSLNNRRQHTFRHISDRETRTLNLMRRQNVYELSIVRTPGTSWITLA